MNSSKKYYQSIYTRFAFPSLDDIYESFNPIQSVEQSLELSSESKLDSDILSCLLILWRIRVQKRTKEKLMMKCSKVILKILITLI